MTSLSPAPHPDIIDAVTRRELLAMMAAAGLLAACGDDGNDDGNDAAAGDTTRTVRTDDGTIDVPADPRRVVAAIGSFETDVVAVGIMPVLTTSFAGAWVDLDDTVTVTDNVPPTAEELLTARPDLIIGWNWVTAEPVYDEISAVAPYVGLGESAATAGPGFDGSQPLRSWDTLFLSVCDAVGRREQGEQLVADFDARLDDVAEGRSSEAELSVARIDLYEAGSYTYRGQNEDTAELMRRIGITVIGPEQTTTESLETLPDIDADRLVVAVANDEGKQVLYDELAESPLFQAIPAVRAGNVDLVDATLWPGLGYLWAQALTDDLERLYVPAGGRN